MLPGSPHTVGALEHVTWGGKGGARGQGGMGGPTVRGISYCITYLLLNHGLTSVLKAQEKQGVQTHKLTYSINSRKYS